ncbi:helix-turn-helix domain-containing protein [Cohnella cellulosilytica]|uniref:Helix-turn-helix domain-containing protein n=1 Tax=Cohnella cellulosilytica TaxID=986710 RepID=A0ABW2F647_9BACL
MTYKVMIADDEPIIRDGLKSFIDWSSLGCEIVAIADNGLQARSLLNTLPVDIVLADIRMPGMSGIELAEFAQSRHPGVKLIILTGHAQFSYAQSAIKYGVVDFIVKSNPLEQVTEAVRKAIALIEREREQFRKVERLERQIDDDRREIRGKLLLDAIRRIVSDPGELKARAADLGLDLGRYRIMLLKLRRSPGPEREPDAEERMRYLQAVSRLYELAFRRYRPYLLYVDDKSLCAIPRFGEQGGDAGFEAAGAHFEQTLQATASGNGLSVVIGLSDVSGDPAELPALYRQALDRLAADAAENAPKLRQAVSQHAVIGKIVDYIAACYEEKISLESLAEQFHMNASYLSRLFKKEIGESLIDYLTRLRIDKARQLLMETDYIVLEIATRVGFGDASYFSNTFKRLTGLSPREYKQTHRGG